MKRHGKMRILGSIALATAMIVSGTFSGSAKNMFSVSTSQAAGTTNITIDGSDVETAAKNVNGLPYKGFGVLSGNSTSDLLIDYKYQYPSKYNELLQVLFGGEHPLMNHVKMEMGNDGNNSTGADSCTMRYEDEEADASRSPGFILAADAKKVNPNVKVSILRWEMPAWVQKYWDSSKTTKGYEAMYKWYKETALDCFEKYGYLFDYINPDKNETQTPDVDFIKWFRDRVSNDNDFPAYMTEEAIKAYHNTKIVASDEYISLNIVPAMRKDNDLYKAVDAIGFHYTTGESNSTKDYVKMADVDDKEVWYSEGCGSFSYTEYQKNKTASIQNNKAIDYGAGTIGGYQSPIAMCDCMIKSAVYSRKTHYIFQPAIGSFYEGAQYDHKELLSAREPWAGTIHYDQAIYCLQHFSKFAKTGWENETNTAGIWRYIANASKNSSSGTEHITNTSGKPSYMTLASPDKKDFSTIVVNNSNKTLSYNIAVQGMDIASGTKLEKFVTKTGSYMQYEGDVEDNGQGYSFDVEPFSIVTVTTLKCNGKDEYKTRLPEDSEGVVLDTNKSGSKIDFTDETLYADDFSYADYDSDYLKNRGNEPRYMVDFSGAFLVENGRLKQELKKKISQWQNNTPSTVVGDHRWMNYDASVDIELPDGGYAGIVIRQQTGMAYDGSGYSLRIDSKGAWTFNKRSTKIASGQVDVKSEGAYRLTLSGRGNKITASIDGNVLKEYTDNNAELFGRVRLFSGWNTAYYDNLVVTKPEGGQDIDTIPYGKSLIDNAADKVSYEGTWEITPNGSSNDWFRSLSKSSTEGAAFSFKTKADGFALIGQNSTGKVDIICDGKTVKEDEAIKKSNQHCSFIVVNGLGEAEHDIKVVLKSGSLTLDAIMPISLSYPPEVKLPEPTIEPTIAPEESITPDESANPSSNPEESSNPEVSENPVVSSEPSESASPSAVPNESTRPETTTVPAQESLKPTTEPTVSLNPATANPTESILPGETIKPDEAAQDKKDSEKVDNQSSSEITFKKKSGKTTIVYVGNKAKKTATVKSVKTSKQGPVTIPQKVKADGVTFKVNKIGAKAFSGNKKLKTIVIKASAVTSVGKQAFKGIAKKAVVKIKAGNKQYKKIVKLIKKSKGLPKKIKFKRV